MSIAVTDSKGVILSENYGTLNAEANRFQTVDGSLYRIASVSKVVTGMVIMKLVEDNNLDLDVPIKRYIPSLKLSSSETEEYVTLRHLLSHTAGFPKEYEPDGCRDESMLKKTIQEQLSTIRITAQLGEHKFCYSNWGIRLASFVAQEVTGELFSNLAIRLILKPLDMNQTTYDPLVALTYPTSMPHVYSSGEYKVIHKINENASRYAAGGLFSNTADLCKLARMVLNDGKNDNGNQVLSSQSLHEMISVNAFCHETYYGYGLATMLFEKDDIRTIGHLGSHPPYAASFMVNLKSGYGIVFPRHFLLQIFIWSLPMAPVISPPASVCYRPFIWTRMKQMNLRQMNMNQTRY